MFEELDRDADVRIVVLRAEGEHFSSGGETPGFLERSPEHVSELARNVAAFELSLGGRAAKQSRRARREQIVCVRRFAALFVDVLDRRGRQGAGAPPLNPVSA